jgi:hypothetical protein
VWRPLDTAAFFPCALLVSFVIVCIVHKTFLTPPGQESMVDLAQTNALTLLPFHNTIVKQYWFMIVRCFQIDIRVRDMAQDPMLASRYF